MKIRNRLKLKSYYLFWLVLAISLLPIIIVGVIAFNASARLIHEQTSAYSMNILQQVKENIDGVFNQVENASMLIYTHVDIQQLRTLDAQKTKLGGYEEKSIQLLIDNIARANKHLNNIIVLDNYGNVYSRFLEQNLYLQNSYTHFNTYKQFATSNEMVQWFGIHRNENGQQTTTIGGSAYDFSYMRKISDLEGSGQLAVLEIDMNQSLIEELCSKVNWPEKGVMVVVDDQDRIAYYTNRPDLTGHMLQQTELAHLNSQGDQGSYNVEINGDKKVVTFVTSEYSKWKIMNVVSHKFLLGYTEGLKAIILFVSISSILAVTGGAYVITSRISMLIVELRRITASVSMDQPSTKALIKSHIRYWPQRSSYTDIITGIKQLLTKMHLAEQKKKEAEFAALQANIHPHFLYNSLEMVRMMAVIDKNERIAHTVEMLANLFRYIVNSVDEFVTLAEEIDNVRHYVSIQKLRHGKRLNVHIELPEHIRSCMIVRLSLQPLVENAIIHGVEQQSGPVWIRIRAYAFGNNIAIIVADNGPGIAYERWLELKAELAQANGIKSGTRIGIVNVHQRLKVYFGEGFGLRIYSKQAKGTIIKVTVPRTAGSERLR
ncbi:sensor histidine kinase YesM [Paenibacillus marchantiophytorum]|uniref:histidine kinase n=1 Tax=Paenibacillus marchantiophytorum TaxID=1619310 RepID=A0ABQ1EYM8_9BACL|nr:sensor histidine kinase [Paenibacillus marchantiophytorum]GFZ91896.1 sensor histidine kinase YesM [Paenibacillus marchantiophytorum]